MVLLLFALGALAATPWSVLVQTRPVPAHPDASSGCSTADTGSVTALPVVLSEDGLVYVEVADWDAPVLVGLSDGGNTCHGAFAPPHPLELAAAAPRGMVRWLPAGSHVVEVWSGGPASAIVAVNVVSTDMLVSWGVEAELARTALLAADRAWTEGHARRPALAIVDFALPSTQERLWLVDLADGQLRHHLFVSHGKSSGHPTDARRAVRFSNRPRSNQSSPGLFRASETYVGDHGRSMRLDGLEPAINDLARDRAIVVHGAEYARVEHIEEWGYLGRSRGCPAVDDRVVQRLIDELHDGGLLYVRGRGLPADCCVLREGTEASPAPVYLPDPLGRISIY